MTPYEEFCRKTYLFGFMPLSEANGVLMGDLGHNIQVAELREKWLSKVSVANKLSLTDPYIVNDPNAVMADFDENLKDKAANTTKRLKERQFWHDAQFEIKLVDMNYLVALQNNINLDRVDGFKRRLKQPVTTEQILDLCFQFDRNPPATDSHVVGQNSWIFSSEDEDVRLGNPQIRMLPQHEEDEGGDSKLVPSFVLPVLGGDPFVNAIQTHISGRNESGVIETRYWLTLQNGFHRAYALKSIGLEQIPCAVITPQTAQETAMLSTNWSPERQQQANTARPPLLRDFFNPDLTETLPVKKRRTAWKLTWQQERLTV